MLEEIGNYYEQLVFSRAQELLRGRVTSDELEDIVCLALNALPARYVRHPADLVDHLSDVEWEETMGRVMSAIEEARTMVRRRGDERRRS